MEYWCWRWYPITADTKLRSIGGYPRAQLAPHKYGARIRGFSGFFAAILPQYALAVVAGWACQAPE